MMMIPRRFFILAFLSFLSVGSLHAQTDTFPRSPEVSPPDSSDLVGKVRRALWDYYFIANQRGGHIKDLYTVNPVTGPSRPDPDGRDPFVCSGDLLELCVRGVRVSLDAFQSAPGSNRGGPRVGLVDEAGGATDPAAFALAPRPTVTERAAAQSAAPSPELEVIEEARGRTHCHANLGAFCLQGDWDTAPCKSSNSFECHPKTPEMNLEDREAMMAVIDSAVAILPGNAFVVGQAVYANVKFRRPVQTTLALRNCRAAAWWCHALEGFVNHHAGRPVESERAFEEALLLMPEEARCEWTDHMELLDFGDRGRYRDLGCGADRDTVNRSLWWLSDPLFIHPGNDRFTEQMARHVGLIMHAELVDILGGRHARAHDRLITRYGFEDSYQESGWDRVAGLCCGLTFPSAPFSFVPGMEAIADPTSASRDAWEIGYQDQVEGYTWWGRFFVDLPVQSGYFRRGESALFFVATDVERQPLLEPWEYSAGLYLGEGPSAPERLVVDPVRRPSYRWTVPVSAVPHLVSVEAVAPEQGAARVRFGQAPPFSVDERLGLSDIIVYQPSGPDPESLEQVLRLAYGRTSVTSTEDLGLYFEVYGAERDETTTFRLEVLEPRPGILSVIGRALGITSSEDLRLEWSAPADPDESGVWVNALDIDLSEFDNGEYTFELQVSVGGLRPMTVRRTIFVVEN